MNALIKQLLPHLTHEVDTLNPSGHQLKDEHFEKGWWYVKRGHETDALALIKLALPVQEIYTNPEEQSYPVHSYLLIDGVSTPFYAGYRNPLWLHVCNTTTIQEWIDEQP